jgi:hypothetical protein
MLRLPVPLFLPVKSTQRRISYHIIPIVPFLCSAIHFVRSAKPLLAAQKPILPYIRQTLWLFLAVLHTILIADSTLPLCIVSLCLLDFFCRGLEDIGCSTATDVLVGSGFSAWLSISVVSKILISDWFGQVLHTQQHPARVWRQPGHHCVPCFHFLLGQWCTPRFSGLGFQETRGRGQRKRWRRCLCIYISSCSIIKLGRFDVQRGDEHTCAATSMRLFVSS